MKKKQTRNIETNFRPLASVFCMLGAVLIVVLHSDENVLVGQLSDVAKNSYEGQAALYLQQRGIISGFPDGTFRGQNPVNRVEAAKMLLLSGNYTLRQLQNLRTFADIETGSWYEQFALNAVDQGMMSGYPDGSFGPSRTVIRAEFLKMLSNAFRLETNLPYHYTDVPVDAWYSKFSGIAEKYNLFLYDTDQLLPSAPMSREEIAWAIYQMLVLESYNFVVRTPFDYTFYNAPQVPSTMHAAASNSSSPVTSVTSTSSNASMQSSAAASVVEKNCIDSDQTNTFPNGYNINRQGTAVNLLMSNGENSFEDTCEADSNVLLEFYCNDDGFLTAKKVNCTASCTNGACTSSATQAEPEVDPRRPTGTLSSTSSQASSAASSADYCSDTDATHRFMNGENIYAKGTTNGLDDQGEQVAQTDTCNGNDNLTEYSCAPNLQIKSTAYTCANGCNNGACVSPGTTGTCVDQDADVDPSGLDFTRKSRIFVSHPEEGNVSYEDNCTDPNVLEEFYCATNGRVGRYSQVCTCVDGVCVSNE